MRRSLQVTAVAAALVVAVGACGGQKDTGFSNLPSPKATGGKAGGSTGIKLVSGNKFEPQTFSAKVGTTVTWTDADSSAPHNVVSDTGLFDSHPQCANDQTKCMADGQTFTFKFDKAGKYAYYCVIHGTKGGVGMSGVVEVS
jgi:plastocyanin